LNLDYPIKRDLSPITTIIIDYPIKRDLSPLTTVIIEVQL